MIREANKNDIERINELGSLLHSNFTTIFDITKMLEDEVSKIYVYIIDNTIVAFLSVTILYETCDILSIVVDEKYRHQKIATNLMAYLITDLGDNNKMITLEVATKNKAALKLYENFNFKIINIRKNYYQDDDAYLMAREKEN